MEIEIRQVETENTAAAAYGAKWQNSMERSVIHGRGKTPKQNDFRVRCSFPACKCTSNVAFAGEAFAACGVEDGGEGKLKCRDLLNCFIAYRLVFFCVTSDALSCGFNDFLS